MAIDISNIRIQECSDAGLRARHNVENLYGLKPVWVLVDFIKTTNGKRLERVRIDWNCKISVRAFTALADARLRGGWTITTRRNG